MKHRLLPRWLIVLTVLLGGLVGAISVSLVRTVQERIAASLTEPASAGVPDGVSALDRPIRIGVTYIAPEQKPDERIYVEEGFEAGLAEDIGQRLGVPVNLVPISPTQYATALSDGRVDALITRLDEHDPLHQSAQIIQTGYESGLSPVVRSDRPLKAWKDVAGKVVCVTEANEHAQKAAEAFGANVRILRAPAQVLMLVRTGECDAAIHDRAVLDVLFTKLAWQKFSATLPPIEPTPLVIAVAKERGALARELSRIASDVGSKAYWQKRRERWASLVAFEVYRDQVAGDCH